jgi:hypothetical protein
MLDRLAQLSNPSGRELLITAAWSAAQAHPWLGLGPMHFAALPGLLSAHPHNAALQIAAELGLPALALAAWASVKLLAVARRTAVAASPQQAWLAQGALLALLAAGALAMLDGVHVMPVSQSLLAILIGLAIGLRPASGLADAESAASSKAGVLCTALLFATLALVGYSGVSYEAQARSEVRFKSDYGSEKDFPPRFWQQGLLLSAP